MKAILKEDIKNPYGEARQQEVPTSKEEQIAFKKANRRGTPVPTTKWVKEDVYYARIGDKLDVIPTEDFKHYKLEEIELFVLVNAKGERFHVKKGQITLIQ